MNNTTAPTTNGMDEEKKINLILAIVYSTVVFLSFLFNSTIICLFVQMVRTKFTASNFMFFFQAITDCIVAVSMIFKIIYYLHFTLFYVHYFFDELSRYISIVMLLVITVDRYFAITFPFYHRTHATAKNISLLMVVIFFVSSIPAIVSQTYILGKLRSFVENRAIMDYLHTTFVVVFSKGAIQLFFILVIYGLHLLTYLTIRKSIQKRMQQHLQNARGGNNDSAYQAILNEKKRHMRILLILVAMISVYTLTYLPLIMLMILSHPKLNVINQPDQHTANILSISVNIVYDVSALINPLTTLCFNSFYKEAFLMLFKRKPSINSEPRAQVEPPAQMIASVQPVESSQPLTIVQAVKSE